MTCLENKGSVSLSISGTDQIWSFREYVCRIESQKQVAMKCVLFAVNVCICMWNADTHVYRIHLSHIMSLTQ